MALPPGNFTSLPGITNINDAVFEDQIVENLIAFFDWGFLGVGGFFNVKRPSSKSKFKAADVPNFSPGQIWETSKGNWVWENGVTFTPQPILASGVYVNNTFIPNGNGYHLNYEDGQIVFDTAISTASKVEMDFSYRKFNFYEADSDWFHQVVFDPLPESDFKQILAKNRVYLPAVIVEVVGGGNFVGLQIGDNTVIETQPVLFHIIAEHDEDRNRLVHALKRMYNKTIWLYDINKIADEDKFPIKEDGSVSDNPLTYPQLLDRFPWKRCIFANVIPQEQTPQLPLFRAIVRVNLSVHMP